jgi:bifunctional protein TilS/HprT
MTEDTPTFAYYRGAKPPRFATQTELDAAKILDYYRVPWQYEPRTFILERDTAGNILEAFTPDFYLPDLDLYLEVTQMKQSLVTAKNRKVRKLRDQYPEIRIKLLYKNDFIQLAKKYDLAPPR